MDSYKRFASIYDELINEDINYLTWSQRIMEICERLNIKKDDYLDLACGTGNVTERVAPSFKSIWAVDLSEDMLVEADTKLRGKNIKAKCVLQDMRYLTLNKKFDLITCCLDSLNYITDLKDIKQCFSSVKSHLKPEGIFIFDINSYNKLVNIIGNNTFTYTGDDVAYIWENFCENDIVEMYLTFFIKNDDYYERFEEEHIEKAYREEEIEAALESSGFEIIFKMDNYCDSEVSCCTERISYVVRQLGI
jgi:ubiquinone/menaquinone biosynthesis C-methylase UbiE